jgi:excisionase family DNA binding protein
MSPLLIPIGCSRGHVCALARRGELPGWKIGALWRFDPDEVLAFLRRDVIDGDGKIP